MKFLNNLLACSDGEDGRDDDGDNDNHDGEKDDEYDDGDKDDNDWASGCSPLNLCRSELGTFRAEKPPWLQYKSINDDDDGTDVIKLMMGNADAGMMMCW